LGNLPSCPSRWANQARNAILTVNGVPISIPRHIVVATRVNPSAVNQSTRRIQLRAWNHKEESTLNDQFPREAAPEVAAAHLFGLLRTFGLARTRELWLCQWQFEASVQKPTPSIRDYSKPNRSWSVRILNFANADAINLKAGALTVYLIDTPFGFAEVEILEPLLVLAQNLHRAYTSDMAANALAEADRRFDQLEIGKGEPPYDDARRTAPIGLHVRLPHPFDEDY
jgi:hypothetical protein